MKSRKVIWVDDEPNLISGEIFDLETRGFATVPIYDAGMALDWFIKNYIEASQASAIIIDLLMPSRGDPRFKNSNGEPTGLLLCKAIQQAIPNWTTICPWVTLYSRSPNTPSLEFAREYARLNSLHFARKNSTSRIALELIKEKRIRDVET